LNRPPNAYTMHLSVCYLAALDWAEAAKTLQGIISLKENEFDMKGLAGIQLAACYYMLGDEEKAKTLLDQVPGMINKHSRFDKLAEFKYSQFKRRGLGFAVFELMYVRRDLRHMHAQHAEKILSLVETNFSKTKGTPEETAVYSLLKGALLRQTHQESNAKECFKKVISLEPIKDELWCLPNALQELAEIYYFEGNLEESETLLKKANTYRNYDWQDVTSNRINISLQTIKKEKEKKGQAVSEASITPTVEDEEIEDQLNAMNMKDDQDMD